MIKRYAPLILAIQLITLFFFAWRTARMGYDNRIGRFAVANHEAERAYQTFAEAFQPKEIFLVMLSFDGADRPEMVTKGEAFFAELAQLEGISQYQSLKSLGLEGLAEEMLPFPFLQSEKSLYTGIFEIGANREVLLASLPERVEKLRAERGGIREAVLAGEPIVNEYLNRASLEVRNRFFPLLIGSSLVLLTLLFRRWKVLAVTGLAVGGSLTTTMGIMELAGQKMDLVTTLIPALIFVLAVAMQMHVLISIGLRGDVLAGVRDKIGPNCIVSLTTSIGFGSLMTSEVGPIAIMGQYMAIGIWIVFIWTHLTHLGLSLILNLQIRPPIMTLLQRIINSRWYWRCLRKPVLAVIPVLVILGGTAVLLHNPTESNGLNYFPPSHAIRQQTSFLETHVTGGSDLQILLSRPPSQASDGLPYRPPWEQIDQFEADLSQLDHIRHLFSLGQVVNTARALTPGQSDADALLNLVQFTRPAALASLQSPDYYRIQVLVDSLDRDRYRLLKTRIKDLAESAGFTDQLVITGTLDRIIEIQDYLLASLSKSLSLTIAAIIVLMMIILGRKGRFFVILLPNLFPLGMMALALPVLGIETTISTVMVFSIAFGIAVDDSIHLLHTYYHTPSAQLFRERWCITLGRDARAIFLTSLVLAFGFAVLMLASFKPTADFGILMTVGMIFAFVGDAIFLAMLLRVYAPHTEDKAREKESQTLAEPDPVV